MVNSVARMMGRGASRTMGDGGCVDNTVQYGPCLWSRQFKGDLLGGIHYPSFLTILICVSAGNVYQSSWVKVPSPGAHISVGDFLSRLRDTLIMLCLGRSTECPILNQCHHAIRSLNWSLILVGLSLPHTISNSE